MSENGAQISSTEKVESAPDEIWVKRLTDTCLDDVTLPPGGASTKKPANVAPERLQQIPRPDYLTHEGRDLRIDLLRGYFVFAMIVDHVRGPSPLYLITGGNRFYASAAEGFILTSGLVAGLVYRRLIKRDGIAPSMMKVLYRALTLYLLTVAITLIFTLFSEATFMPWAHGVNLSDPIGFVVSVFTLHQTYYLIDVLLLYTLLFAITPMAFVLLDRGKGKILLGVSWLLYLIFQIYPQYSDLPWQINGNYLFAFSAWQAIFFSGLALGYYQQSVPALNKKQTNIALWITGIFLLGLIVLFFLVDTPTGIMPNEIAVTSPIPKETRLWLQDNLFSKGDVRPGRLFASAITFTFLFLVATRYWKVIQRLAAWLLIPLGQFSLYAYTSHIFLVGFVGLAIKSLNLAAPTSQGVNAVIQIASVLLIWLLVNHQFISPTQKTRHIWNLSPIAIAFLVIVFLFRFPMDDHPGMAQTNVSNVSDRTPRRYGTPVPRENTAPVDRSQAVQNLAQPIPTPANTGPIKSLQGGSPTLSSDYLGEIHGTMFERWFYSPELDRDMPYYIYLPPDYDRANRRYPTLYLLHGLGGHREEWLAYFFIDTLDQEIKNNNLKPMIVVLPQGDKEYWVNHAGDGPRWGEYLSRDLVRHIDFTYRTLRSSASRGIGGLSMGGYGALVNAFTHPNTFGVVGAHSASLFTSATAPKILGTGTDFELRDPISLARTRTNLRNLKIWIDVGREDEVWIDLNIMLHNALLLNNIPHIWQVLPGAHDYNYWRNSVLDYVRFYGSALTNP